MTILRTSTNDTDARAVSQTGDPQHAGFQIVRQWESLNATAADALATSLNDCTYYTNPTVDKQTYTGTFIQSRLTPKANQEDSIDIEQTLTKVKANTDSVDADIDQQIGDPAVSGYQLIRSWHYINPYALDTLFPIVSGIESVQDPLGNTEVQAGKFIVSRVRSVEQADRTYDIVQDMVKVETITNDTGLDAKLTDPLIDRAKDIIHPFGEGTGVGRDIIYRYINLDPVSDTFLMAVADTKLVSKMSQNDSFIHVARKSTTEDNRTLTFWVLAQRKQRIAWTGRYATPDHIEDRFDGRDGTIRKKSWYGIDNDCYAGVLSRLNNPASVDTGFSLINYSVRDRDDGSDDWTQTQIRYLNDTQTDSRIINTHGIEHNAIQIKNIKFDNYTTEPTPDVDTYTVNGYKYESEKTWMDERGLISKRVVLTKPDPSNDTLTAEVTDQGNQMHDELDGTNRRERFTYDQVPIGQAQANVNTLASITSDSQIVTNVGYTDIGNGAARIERNIKNFNKGENFFVSEVSSDNNGSMKSIRRTWPVVLDSYADVLMTTGDAVNNFGYNSDSYVHIRAHRTKHYDGTSTVWQMGAVSAILSNVGGGGGPGGGGGAIWIGEDNDSRLAYNYITEVGLEEQIITYQKTFNSFGDARAFADLSDDIITPSGLKRLGSVVLQSSTGKWLAKRVVRA